LKGRVLVVEQQSVG